MIKHIVFWRICENGSEADRREVLRAFADKTAYLQTIIPQIVSAAVGLNTNPEGFHICIDSVFQNEKELQEYIDHPEHLLVREYMNSVSYDKTVFDYEF